MNHDMDLLLLVVAVALVTFLTRAAPFLFFSRLQHSKLLVYLGDQLPSAVMIILVAYCLKSVSFNSGNYGLPELSSLLVVVLVHIWRRNFFLSVGCGSLICIFLLNF